MQGLRTRKSNASRPGRYFIYGIEGVGKSTFGAMAPNPIFISPEGGTDRLKNALGESVDEMMGVNSWDGLLNATMDLKKFNHDFKTVVLDSADWTETLCHQRIIGHSGKSITTVNGGYGTGYRESQQLHRQLIANLEDLRIEKNMNIIVTAHAHVKEVKDPEMVHDYDRFEPKCHDLVASLWREWVDAMFFVRFKTYTNLNEDNAKKARAMSDGERVVYTMSQPAFQAKNRYGLPLEMNFTMNFWNEIQPYVQGGVKAKPLMEEINELVQKVPDGETKDLILKTIKDSENDTEMLFGIKERLIALTGGN